MDVMVVRMRMRCADSASIVTYELTDQEGRRIDGEELRLQEPCRPCDDHKAFTPGCGGCELLLVQLMQEVYWGVVHKRVIRKVGPSKVLKGRMEGELTLVIWLMPLRMAATGQ